MGFVTSLMFVVSTTHYAMTWTSPIASGAEAALDAAVANDKTHYSHIFNAAERYLVIINVSSHLYLNSTVSEQRPCAPSLSALTTSYFGELGYYGTTALT